MNSQELLETKKQGPKYALAPSSHFIRDYKYYNNRHIPLKNLRYVLTLLEYYHHNYKELKDRYDNHTLNGKEKGTNELHLSGNILIKYQIHKKEVTLVLLRLGPHNGKHSVFRD